MTGAPASTTQELAGHADLSTTQRYMHIRPAVTDEAIWLLDERDLGLDGPKERGEVWKTRETGAVSV